MGKDSGETNGVERWNNTLRQRLARFVRKTLSFSKSEVYHRAALKLYLCYYNTEWALSVKCNHYQYTQLIREREMIPGLSTHMPETVPFADKTGADVETYIQLYNAAGFLMQVEADWVMRIIRNAKKPVMTIKPLAAGSLLPVLGLAFVWSTIRDQDMVTIGTTTPDEAWEELVELSLDLLNRRLPDIELQKTRSKTSLT